MGRRTPPGPPRPPREDARSGSPRPCAPQTQPPRRAGCSGRQGAPGPRVPRGPRLLRLRGLPHPEAELQTQRRGEKPSSAPARGPRGQPPDPRHLQRGPRAALVAASSPRDRTRPADPRVYPQLRTRSPPRSLSVQPLPPGCHRAPGPRRRLPTCGRATERGLQPLRGALGAHSPPPALRPAEENRAGCSAGHPRPPISGGDPSRAGTEGRGQQARGPRRGAMLAPPGGRGVATARRDALTAGRSSASPRSVQRGDPHPRSPANLPWGNRQEVPQFPRDPLSPTASPTLLPPYLSCLPQATASPTPQPRASTRSFTAERKNPSPPLAPGAGPGPAIFRSNQSPH
ncbi:collagen alpha-1(I) chain-like [Monodon monoceros]|uniref:collagen alpha-1(I) chain-like n=1 Tax=Monodon monoceros TaxID=40151 RepID=UPI0010F5BC41|nr:collagen alpha-1(I) chain-like [Monodon monoceros]